MRRSSPTLSAWLPFFLLVSSLAFSSCAWTRTEAVEKFQTSPMPIRVGVVLEDNRAAEAEGRSASDYLGPDIAAFFRAWGIFEELVYPYDGDTTVDAVMYLSAQGEIDTHKFSGAGKSFLDGLTFGLFLTLVGKTADLEHEADVRLISRDQFIASYKTEIRTDIRASLAGDQWEQEGGKRAIDEAKRSHTSRLAKALAKQITGDRVLILEAVRSH